MPVDGIFIVSRKWLDLYCQQTRDNTFPTIRGSKNFFFSETINFSRDNSKDENCQMPLSVIRIEGVKLPKIRAT